MLWHQLTQTQIENELQTSVHSGLTSVEAEKRLREQGMNALPEVPPESAAVVFFRQFKDPFVYILLAASAVVFFLHDITDTFFVLGILVFNAVIGSLQEGKARRTFESLKHLSVPECTVLRDGIETVVRELEVVVGEVLVLQEGSRVPADARIVKSNGLKIDESTLTGESGSVDKKAVTIAHVDVPLGSKYNMVFKGTSVTAGFGLAIVVATGRNTELGKISDALQVPHEEIPLQKKIRSLSNAIMVLVVAISVAIMVLGVWRQYGFAHSFELVVSIAVAIIPESLPLIMTLILASGVWQMSKRNALVKKLQAVEALGQASILAVDKTGTITRNEMIVRLLYVGGSRYHISGDGYAPAGSLFRGEQELVPPADVVTAVKMGALSSKAQIRLEQVTQRYIVIGEPTEAALSVLGQKFGFTLAQQSADYDERGEVPFGHPHKYHALYYEHEQGMLCAVAGAPETVIGLCTHVLESGRSVHFDHEQKKLVQKSIQEITEQGLRALALAFRHVGSTHTFQEVESLTLAAVVGIEDSVRAEVPSVVAELAGAGIRTVMITGDHQETARAIAREAGIYNEGDKVLTGADLQQLSESELLKLLPQVSVFSRVTPTDKMSIIQCYKKGGYTIAMTGDGVNDAPSLIAADLGVAMGKIGTEVAKEAADIVLLDDNLSSIMAAVYEGRAMYHKIKKTLLYILAASVGIVAVLVLFLVLNLPMPLEPVQILWLNVINTTFLGLALAFTDAFPHEISSWNPKFARKFFWVSDIIRMALMAAVMAGASWYLYGLYAHEGVVVSGTIVLVTLASVQWLNAFNCLTYRGSIINWRTIWHGRYLWMALAVNVGLQWTALHWSVAQETLKVAPLSTEQWMLILVATGSIVAMDEVRKFGYRLWNRFNP